MKVELVNQLVRVFSERVSLTQDDWDKLLAEMTFEVYQPKDFIFSFNDKPNKIYFVIEGIGRYFYIDQDGKERNKSLVRTGGAFASISTLVENSPSPFYTQAITQCRVAAIEYNTLVTLAQASPNIMTFLLQLFERLVLKKEKREASFLLMSARERYQIFLREFEGESHLIPLRHVAMYLGITDVSLSRIRKEMGLT